MDEPESIIAQVTFDTLTAGTDGVLRTSAVDVKRELIVGRNGALTITETRNGFTAVILSIPAEALRYAVEATVKTKSQPRTYALTPLG